MRTASGVCDTPTRLAAIQPRSLAALTRRAHGVCAVERAPGAWVNLHSMCVPVRFAIGADGAALDLRRDSADCDRAGEEGFLWASERSGHSHLYVQRHEAEAAAAAEGTTSMAGSLVQQLTGGEWEVEQTSANWLHAEEQVLYFMGNRHGWLERAQLGPEAAPAPRSPASQNRRECLWSPRGQIHCD